MREMMEDVVLEGTGKPAQLERIHGGRKIGDGAKNRSGDGRYSATQIQLLVRGFRAGERSGGDDSGSARFAGGRAPWRRGGRTRVQARCRTGAGLHGCAARRADALRSWRRQRTRGQRRLAAGSDPQRKQDRKARFEEPSRGEESERRGADRSAFRRSGSWLRCPIWRGKRCARVTEDARGSGLSPTLIGSGVALEQFPERRHAGSARQPGDGAVRHEPAAICVPHVRPKGVGN